MCKDVTAVHLQVATMGTRRKLSVSVNSCGICGGVLKVGSQPMHSLIIACAVVAYTTPANGLQSCYA